VSLVNHRRSKQQAVNNQLRPDAAVLRARIQTHLKAVIRFNAVRPQGIRLARNVALWQLTEPGLPNQGLWHARQLTSEALHDLDSTQAESDPGGERPCVPAVSPAEPLPQPARASRSCRHPASRRNGSQRVHKLFSFVLLHPTQPHHDTINDRTDAVAREQASQGGAASLLPRPAPVTATAVYPPHHYRPRRDCRLPAHSTSATPLSLRRPSSRPTASATALRPPHRGASRRVAIAAVPRAASPPRCAARRHPSVPRPRGVARRVATATRRGVATLAVLRSRGVAQHAGGAGQATRADGHASLPGPTTGPRHRIVRVSLPVPRFTLPRSFHDGRKAPLCSNADGAKRPRSDDCATSLPPKYGGWRGDEPAGRRRTGCGGWRCSSSRSSRCCCRGTCCAGGGS